MFPVWHLCFIDHLIFIREFKCFIDIEVYQYYFSQLLFYVILLLFKVASILCS